MWQFTRATLLPAGPHAKHRDQSERHCRPNPCNTLKTRAISIWTRRKPRKTVLRYGFHRVQFCASQIIVRWFFWRCDLLAQGAKGVAQVATRWAVRYNTRQVESLAIYLRSRTVRDQPVVGVDQLGVSKFDQWWTLSKHWDSKSTSGVNWV